MPQAIIAFPESDDLEDAIRKAVSIGSDSDTIASTAGGIAQAYYKDKPSEITRGVRNRLPGNFLRIIDRFNTAYL
ncbi:ADP-ribosylglycohydrolase family protein [Planctomycetota bacterium]